MSPKVSEQHRAERREALLKSALQCFSDRGYEATTVDDIVQAAGVSKGMVYTYFSSKEEIFLELIKERTERSFMQVAEAYKTIPTAWEKLSYLLNLYKITPPDADTRKWITVYLEFFLSTARSEIRLSFMKQRYQQYVNLLVDVIIEGKRTGEFRNDVNAEAVSALYWAICDGIHLHVSQLPDLQHYEAIYEAAADMVYRHVRNEQTL